MKTFNQFLLEDPYQHDLQARMWGFIKPSGKVIDGNVIKNKHGHRVDSHGLLSREAMKLSYPDEIANPARSKIAVEKFELDHVRFAILRNGASLYSIDVGSLSPSSWMRHFKTIKKFIDTNPMVNGEVTLDLAINGKSASERNQYYANRWPTDKQASAAISAAIRTKSLDGWHLDKDFSMAGSLEKLFDPNISDDDDDDDEPDEEWFRTTLGYSSSEIIKLRAIGTIK